MSMPNIPDVNPNIDLDIEDSVKMLLNSIALNEMGLSHIVNAEGEKIQYLLGTLNNNKINTCEDLDVDKILSVNKYVNRVLRGILNNQMLLQMKMEDTVDLYDKIHPEEKKDGYIDDAVNCSYRTNYFSNDHEYIEEDNSNKYEELDEGIVCEPIHFNGGF